MSLGIAVLSPGDLRLAWEDRVAPVKQAFSFINIKPASAEEPEAGRSIRVLYEAVLFYIAVEKFDRPLHSLAEIVRNVVIVSFVFIQLYVLVRFNGLIKE